MKPLARLRHHYEHSLAAAETVRAAGVPIVGIVGNTVPAELVRAAGCFPLTLTGEPRDTSVGDRLMETFFEPEIRFVFDALLRGSFGELALVIVPRTSDQYFKLYLYLREAVRIGKGERVPPLHLYDLLHTRNDRSRRYGLERTTELAQRLAQARGRAIEDDAIRAAISQSNRARELVTRLLQLRTERPCSLSGVDALAAIGASRFMAIEDFCETIEALLATPAKGSLGGPRILIKGFPLNHRRLHTTIENAGCVVIAEDDWWGSRSAGDPIDEQGSPLEALFEKYFRDVPSPRVHSDELRQQWFKERLAEGDIDGVIFYVPPFDDLIGWELPADRALTQARKIPSLVLRCDAGAEHPPLEHELLPFLRGLTQGAAAHG